jgi:hypothetical protein
MSQRRVLDAELALPGHGMPATEAERDAVREQLERILAHPLFTHSKRYPLLLRGVVERALDGRAGQLKERTLGVEVFGRDPDYDTNTDPVVRITAGEIRKRIAQYYHEASRENELRIDLPCGCYVPEFSRPHSHDSYERPASVELLLKNDFPLAAAPFVAPATLPIQSRKSAYWSAAAVVAVAAGLSYWLLAPSPVERFWRPFWDSPGSALLCIGGMGIAQDVAAMPPPSDQLTVTDQIRREYVAFADATTLSRFSGLFQAKGRPYAMRIGSMTSFADLRSGPVVLIGGFNNGWTMRLLSQLRYSLGRDPATKVEWIEDRLNPANRDWRVDSTTPNLKLTDDYAIVSRVLDPATERMVVVAAGLVQYGTIAAGEFLTNPRYLEELAKRAPSNWQHMNMQVILATKVINGNSGPPRILTTHFW